jgi:hypothetical protein
MSAYTDIGRKPLFQYHKKTPMNLFLLLHPYSKSQKDPSYKHGSAHHAPIHDQSEGSEFLDDAIHSEDVPDMPVYYTEESKKPIGNRQ